MVEGEEQSYISQSNPAAMRLKWHAGVETHRGEEQSYISQRDPATVRLKRHAGIEAMKKTAALRQE